jgi:hypothetical protein
MFEISLYSSTGLVVREVADYPTRWGLASWRRWIGCVRQGDPEVWVHTNTNDVVLIFPL